MKRLQLLGMLFAVSSLVMAQQPVATAPMELYGDHVFVNLSVDGSEPLDFIFDSGSGLTVIDIRRAEELQLDLHHKESVAGAQGYVEGAKIKHNRIDMGSVRMESNVTLEAFDLNHLSISIGRRVDGIIGYDLLLHHVVRLNYDEQILEVYNPGAYPQKGKPVSFKLSSSIPVIEGTVSLNNGDEETVSLFVNTGAGTTMDFNTPYARSKDLLLKAGDNYIYYVKGVGEKETVHYECRIQSLGLDFGSFENLPVGVSQVEAGLQGNKKVSGILGNKVLSKFNIIFDYANHKIFFERNGLQDKPFTVNCSGLDVQMDKTMNKVLIHQVQDGGPASESGILVDDELISINGTSSSDLSLIEIEDLLKKSGTSVELVVKGADELKKVTLDLKELL